MSVLSANVLPHARIVLPNARRFLPLLLTTTALTLPHAYAEGPLPAGARVSAGSAAIETSGKTTTIKQNTDKAIIDWTSFSIGKGYEVNFLQPGSTSAVLNRVTGDTTSILAGTLTANGQVYLINPNGIAITSDGIVNVGGGFVSSTLDIDNDDFLNGRLTFTGTGKSAGISNAGIVQVGRGGYAALIGGSVRNDGLVAVPLGQIGLAAGEQVTLDFSGDGFLQVALPTDAMGDGPLVDSPGTLSASGGMVLMTAALAREAARNTINLSGVVEATAIDGHDGAIIIRGGENGTVNISGRLSATSEQGKGGIIQVTGKDIVLSGATVDASGALGGGSVRIGGDWQGAETLQTAETTRIDADATLRADATAEGDGGDVVVWSDKLTTFDGLITARGAGSGKGGDAEVSGKVKLAYTGYTDLSATNGTFGNLLLDPYNLTISEATDASMSGFDAAGNDSVLNVSTLTTALSGANVTVTTGVSGAQSGYIRVLAPIVWSADTTLSLDAAQDIAFFADIIATGDSAGLMLAYGGDYVFLNGSSATLSGDHASLIINGDAYTLLHSMTEIDAIDTMGLAGHYALAESIDASSFTYAGAVAGTHADPFTGVFTGLGHVISGLTINAGNTTSYTGLFGDNQGTLRDIGLTGGNLIAGDHTGALAGYSDGTIKNVWSSVDVTGSSILGGLVGQNDGTIQNAHVTGEVSGTIAVGGLVGYNFGNITNVYTTGNVSGSANSIGGLVGDYADGILTNGYALGDVSGSHNVGGLIGDLSGGSVSIVHADGDVSGISYIGGLVGSAGSSTLSDAYATGAVTGSDSYIGGVVGYNAATFSRIYASGLVTGSNYVGGVVGYNVSGTITSSYYDRDTTGQALGVGTNAAGMVNYVAMTTEEARDASTYTNFDFNTVWYQGVDMRPILRGEAAAPVGGLVAISNLNQLALIGTNLSGSYLLTTDIDANATSGSNAAGIWGTGGWVPLGTYTGTLFSGEFDGAGHVITNLSIDRPTRNYVGLFGTINGEVHDVGLEGSEVSGLDSVGPLIGLNYGTVYNVFASGNTYGRNNVGGLIGFNRDASILNAFASGTVTGSGYYTGGLVGYHQSSFLSNAYATAATTGNEYVGGLIGAIASTSTISGTYATGEVTGNTFLGGLIGDISNSDGSVSSSFFDTNTTGLNVGLGGNTGGGTADITALTTAQFQNSGYFYNLAAAKGWDFVTDWAPPSAGYYPELYVLSPVVWTGNLTASSTYGDSTATVASGGTDFIGGPSTYIFGKPNDSLSVSPPATVSVDPTANAGSSVVEYTAPDSTSTSERGVDYRIVNFSEIALTIDPRAITISADDLARIYGDANPPLTYTISSGNLVNGDTLSGSLTTSADGTSGAGTYAITQGTLANANYAITFDAGELTVTPRAITITADDLSRIYGDANPALTYAITTGNLINGDTLSGTLATSATATSSVGMHTITQGTLANANYVITFADGELTVTPRAITITADDLTRVYGDANPELTYAVTAGNLVNGDTLNGMLTANADATSNTGTYAITQGSLANANYTITFADGALTVTPRAITVTADDLSRIFGEANPALTYAITAGNLVNGDTLSGALTTSADETSVVGAYDITQGSLSASSNYDLTYIGGTLTIEPEPSPGIDRDSVGNALDGARGQNLILPSGGRQTPPGARTLVTSDNRNGQQNYEDPTLENAVCLEDTPFAVVCSKTSHKKD